MIVQFKRKPHGKTANLNDNDARDRREIYELNLDKMINPSCFYSRSRPPPTESQYA
jgi:hypothetical protein